MNFISCNSQLRSQLWNITLRLSTCRHDATCPQFYKYFPFHQRLSSLTNSTDRLATMFCEKEHETLRHCFIEFSSFRNRLYHPSRAQSLSLFQSVTHLAFDLFFGNGTQYGVSLCARGATSMHGCMCITMDLCTDQSITTSCHLIICARQDNFRSLNRAALCGCWVWIVNWN